jgi:hypothetical protein
MERAASTTPQRAADAKQQRPRVVGICGYATVGKDSVAAHLATRHGYVHASFADRIRAFASFVDPVVGVRCGFVPSADSLLVRYSEALGELGYTEAKRRYPRLRQFLVSLGEGARRFIAPDVWLDAVLPPGYSGPELVVSDVRYPNEGKRVKELRGVTIRVDRPGVEPANEHEAKHTLEIEVDAVIVNDGTLEQLYAKVDDVAARLGIA